MNNREHGIWIQELEYKHFLLVDDVSFLRNGEVRIPVQRKMTKDQIKQFTANLMLQGCEVVIQVKSVALISS